MTGIIFFSTKSSRMLGPVNVYVVYYNLGIQKDSIQIHYEFKPKSRIISTLPLPTSIELKKTLGNHELLIGGRAWMFHTQNHGAIKLE